jgi:hypothetical protein
MTVKKATGFVDRKITDFEQAVDNKGKKLKYGFIIIEGGYRVKVALDHS